MLFGHTDVLTARFPALGGLTRAYSGVTSSCLELASVIEYVPTVDVHCSVALSSLGSFYHVVNRIEGGIIESEEFNPDRVEVGLSLPADKIELFQKTFSAHFIRTGEGELK